MNINQKRWLRFAAISIAAGALIFVAALALMDFDFKKSSTEKYKTNEYNFSEDFENISINVETAQVSFAPSNEDKCRVECFEEEKAEHTVKIQDNTLIIEAAKNKKWHAEIGIVFQTPKITVYLPETEYIALYAKTLTGDIVIPEMYSFETVSIIGSTSDVICNVSAAESIEITTTTGKICVSSMKTGKIKLFASTGDITLNNAACNSLITKNTTGYICLENVIAEESISAQSSTGDIKFERCDGRDITVKTSTGDVRGTLISPKNFVTYTSIGKVSVPKSVSGGKCEITTSTGDIEIEIE